MTATMKAGGSCLAQLARLTGRRYGPAYTWWHEYGSAGGRIFPITWRGGAPAWPWLAHWRGVGRRWRRRRAPRGRNGPPTQMAGRSWPSSSCGYGAAGATPCATAALRVVGSTCALWGRSAAQQQSVRAGDTSVERAVDPSQRTGENLGGDARLRYGANLLSVAVFSATHTIAPVSALTIVLLAVCVSCCVCYRLC